MIKDGHTYWLQYPWQPEQATVIDCSTDLDTMRPVYLVTTSRSGDGGFVVYGNELGPRWRAYVGAIWRFLLRGPHAPEDALL